MLFISIIESLVRAVQWRIVGYQGRGARYFVEPSALVGETVHAFFNCDFHGEYKFSQVVQVVPW